jgi:hypothetical protein
MWRLNRVAVVLTSESVAFADQARDNAWRQDLSTRSRYRGCGSVHLRVSTAVFWRCGGSTGQLDSSHLAVEIVTGMAPSWPSGAHEHEPSATGLRCAHSSPAQWFRDGLFVTHPDPNASRHGGLSESGSEHGRRIPCGSGAISHQNDEWLRYLTPSYLVNADVLAALKCSPP